LSYSGGENISATIYRFSLIFISLMRMVNLYFFNVERQAEPPSHRINGPPVFISNRLVFLFRMLKDHLNFYYNIR